jgi:hypothetical protein
MPHNKIQVRIYLSHQAVEAASHTSKITGTNFSKAIESLILSGFETGEADNAKSKHSLST